MYFQELNTKYLRKFILEINEEYMIILIVFEIYFF